MEVIGIVSQFLPHLSQLGIIILLIALLFFRNFSKEKEILIKLDNLVSKIDAIQEKFEREIKEVKEEVRAESEKRQSLELKLAEKYLTVEHWLTLNNKFEAFIKKELEEIKKLILEVIKDGKAS